MKIEKKHLVLCTIPLAGGAIVADAWLVGYAFAWTYNWFLKKK